MNNQQKLFVIRIDCYELISLQNFSVINPQIIVYQQMGNQWYEKGKTEIQYSQRNPKFSTPISINYEFEFQFNVKFEIFHCDQNKKHPIGNTILNINKLLGAKDQINYTDIMSHNKMVGKILIMGEYQKQKCDLVELQISIPNFQMILASRNLNLKKWCTCWIPPSRPFIKISRELSDSSKSAHVLKSESINYPQSQSWPTIKVLARDLCNNDYENALKIEVIEQINKADTVLIGQLKVSINQLLDSKNFRMIRDQNEVNKGELLINCKLTDQPTFEEYIQGGLQLNLMISIDFTDSNLEPNNPLSLHHFSSNNLKLSKYETALKTVSSILIQYDHDKKIPLYGFGFVLPDSDKTEHCFPLNGNYEDPEVQDLEGIFYTYRSFLPKIKFSGPTLMRPTICEAMKIARGFKNNGSEKYVVLTILTDGQIGDFEGTFEKIVDCCDLPISIIIIGIGNEDFTSMQRLNNDDLKEIDQQGRKATRDLVKFVDFKYYFDDSKILAKEVLSELPDQVVKYMMSIGKLPNKKQQNYNDLNSNGNNVQQYYKRIERQNTIKRLLNDDEDIKDRDEGTIISKNFIKNNPLQIEQVQVNQFNNQEIQNPNEQFQQQNLNYQEMPQININQKQNLNSQEIQLVNINEQQNDTIKESQVKVNQLKIFQGSLENVLNPLNYVNVNNPMISAVNPLQNQSYQNQQQQPNNQLNFNIQNQQFQQQDEQNHEANDGGQRIDSITQDLQQLNQNQGMSDAQFQQNYARLSAILGQKKE